MTRRGVPGRLDPRVFRRLGRRAMPFPSPTSTTRPAGSTRPSAGPARTPWSGRSAPSRSGPGSVRTHPSRRSVGPSVTTSTSSRAASSSPSSTSPTRGRFLENFYPQGPAFGGQGPDRRSGRLRHPRRHEAPAGRGPAGQPPAPAWSRGLRGEKSRGRRRQGQVSPGSYVIRMDQPYSRCADMLLDTQYYNPKDPRPYDDTGWTLGPLHNVRTVRVTDVKALDAEMSPLRQDAADRRRSHGGGQGRRLRRDTWPSPSSMTFRYKLRDINMLAAEDAFSQADARFNAGSFIIPKSGNPADLADRLASVCREILGPHRPRPAVAALGQNARARRAPDCPPRFLAQHPGRGLVPAGAGQAGSSLCLHPPSGNPRR